ncbi:MAG: hypothetical protein GVY24_06840 [Planctomycetes bacterium]|nr:hypothetical protein [Planctomycetota bacterium]
MPEFTHICWLEDDEANVEEHGVTVAEFEAVLKARFDDRKPSLARNGRWVVQGHTPAGRFLVVVFDYLESEDMVIPITAYEPTRP